MSIIALFLIFAFAVLSVTAGFGSAVFVLLAGLLAYIFVYVRTKKTDRNTSRVFLITFSINTLYAVLCYAFMQNHYYSYLLNFDTDNVIMPLLNKFLNSSDGYWTTIKDIWSEYDFFDRFQVGYYTYLYSWGYVAKLFPLDVDIYFATQLAHYTFASFIAPLLYRILVMNNMSCKNAFGYSLIISLCSILFFYSSSIIRDGMITTLMVYIYYVMLHEVNSYNYVKIIVAVYFMSILRIESGMFAVIYLPMYYYMWMGRQGKSGSYFLTFLIMAIFILSFIIMNYSRAIRVYNNNYDIYVEGVDEGSGVIGFLQRIPVLGNFLGTGGIFRGWAIPGR